MHSLLSQLDQKNFQPKMGVFYHEEPQKHYSKRCKNIAATLKEAFSYCQSPSKRNLSTASSVEEEFPINHLDEEQAVLSEIRSRAMEKQKKNKPTLFLYLTPTTIAPPQLREGDGEDEEHDETREEEEFLSVKSCFSCCPSSSSNVVVSNDEAFYSMRTNFSRCSSMNEVEFSEYWKSSIIQEFYHCEGWPFGLCRKALLLPPLPKSPSESWLLGKIQRGSKDT